MHVYTHTHTHTCTHTHTHNTGKHQEQKALSLTSQEPKTWAISASKRSGIQEQSERQH